MNSFSRNSSFLVLGIISILTITSCAFPKYLKNISPYKQDCYNKKHEASMSSLLIDWGNFWKMDSLGSNSFRKYFTTNTLLLSKNMDVDYEFVLDKFGPGRDLPINKGKYLQIEYVIFDTDRMDEYWKVYNTKEVLCFYFDIKSKKLSAIKKKKITKKT